MEYFVWDFGDGTVIDFSDEDSEDPDVVEAFMMQIIEHGGNPNELIHTYKSVGTYTLVVTAYNAGMDSVSKTVTIIVKGHPTITFVSEGEIYETLEVPKNDNTGDYEPNVPDSDRLPVDPVKEGYTFSGWYTDDGGLFDFTKPLGKHVTLTAKFVEGEDVVLHTISFPGGEAPSFRVVDGQAASKPVDPVNPGYTFEGWYTDTGLTQPYDWDIPVTQNVTLYAKWAEELVEPEEHSIAFSGAPIHTIHVLDGEIASKPADPLKDGFEFAGWYTDPGLTQLYDWNAPVTKDIVLYAKWVEATVEPEIHTITFLGAEVRTMQVEDGRAAEAPSDPLKDGFEFAGWYTDTGLTQPYDWDAPVTQDMTLYAKWTKASSGDGTEGGPGDGINTPVVIASVVVILLGIGAIVFASSTGMPILKVLGLIILIIGGISAYAGAIGSDIISLIKDLL